MSDNVVDWHSGFYGAIGLEFLENDADLEYDSEHQLNHNPVRIDLLVVKKNKDIELINELGAKFRGHNIMEYKSEKDRLSIDTVFKANAYAALYKAYGKSIDEIKADDITVTLARETYPRDAFKALRAYGYEIEQVHPGIYLVTGRYIFPTQIVVFNQLDEKLHFWLTNLHRNIDKNRMKEAVLKVYDLRGKAGLMYGKAYISTVIEANGKTVRELSKEEGFDMGKVMEELLHDRLKERDALNKQEGIKEGIKEGMKQGITEGIKEGRITAFAEMVREGVISIAEAAKRSGLTEAAFRKIAVL